MKGQIYVGQAFFFPLKAPSEKKLHFLWREKDENWAKKRNFKLKAWKFILIKMFNLFSTSDSQRPENKISCGSSSSRRINLHVSGDSKTSGAISEFLWMQMLQPSFKVRLRVFSSVADRPDVNPLFMLRVDASGMLFFIVTHYFCVITVCSRRHDSSSGTHTYLSV